MHAIILAGGKGTRLKPYTMSFPKPLVPIGQYPIIEIIIRQLAYYGFKRITISTGYLAELIEAYCGSGEKWNVGIEYVREDTPLNTAGALKLVKDCEENLLVMNGDVLTNIDLGKLYSLHVSMGNKATVASKIRESKIDFGVLKLDEKDFLSDYIEKPVYTFLVSMGVYVLSSDVINFISEGESIGMPDLLLRLEKSGERVFCYKSDCYWLDIGRVDDYERAQEDFEINKHNFLRDNEE